MKAVIQRVTEATVSVDNKIIGKINSGLLILVAFGQNETQEEYNWMIRKILSMRIFNDSNGIMNLSINEINGELLIVSQFTLFADTKKGNRPSYTQALPPNFAQAEYNKFLEIFKSSTPLKIETGIFGADMKVKLLNDGPVTILLDSKNK
ncbi:MAG: D-tyrosyl-tRNA(Tyr) deacylase [Bacteroidia bacterium]|nr:D-tyrosyl-tRNA(Tyr) deacylase [Bacteroidia bacterium]